MTKYHHEIAKAEVAVLRWRSSGRVDVPFEYAVEHTLWAARDGRTSSEVCAALGEPRPRASWEDALWLIAEYASAGMRVARGAGRKMR